MFSVNENHRRILNDGRGKSREVKSGRRGTLAEALNICPCGYMWVQGWTTPFKLSISSHVPTSHMAMPESL